MCLPSNHILCVEDSVDTCHLIEITMPDLSFTFAHTFAGGLNLVKRELFDLYLLDNWLPDGSGVELCLEIRRTNPNTPVIFLSGAAYASDHDEAMAAGATVYLDKPLDFDRLERTLAALLPAVSQCCEAKE